MEPAAVVLDTQADAFSQILSVVLHLAERIKITQWQDMYFQTTLPIAMSSKEQGAMPYALGSGVGASTWV
jgi:hypothetical protein